MFLIISLTSGLQPNLSKTSTFSIFLFGWNMPFCCASLTQVLTVPLHSYSGWTSELCSATSSQPSRLHHTAFFWSTDIWKKRAKCLINIVDTSRSSFSNHKIISKSIRKLFYCSHYKYKIMSKYFSGALIFKRKPFQLSFLFLVLCSSFQCWIISLQFSHGLK